MTGQQQSKLVVERVDVLPSRPWVFLSGPLTGAPIAAGEDVAIHFGNGPAIHATVLAIELHGRPGTTTVAIDGSLRDSVGPGAVVTTELE